MQHFSTDGVCPYVDHLIRCMSIKMRKAGGKTSLGRRVSWKKKKKTILHVMLELDLTSFWIFIEWTFFLFLFYKDTIQWEEGWFNKYKIGPFLDPTSVTVGWHKCNWGWPKWTPWRWILFRRTFYTRNTPRRIRDTKGGGIATWESGPRRREKVEWTWRSRWWVRGLRLGVRGERVRSREGASPSTLNKGGQIMELSNTSDPPDHSTPYYCLLFEIIFFS